MNRNLLITILLLAAALTFTHYVSKDISADQATPSLTAEPAANQTTQKDPYSREFHWNKKLGEWVKN